MKIDPPRAAPDGVEQGHAEEQHKALQPQQRPHPAGNAAGLASRLGRDCLVHGYLPQIAPIMLPPSPGFTDKKAVSGSENAVLEPGT
jgi:hypothetical protein